MPQWKGPRRTHGVVARSVLGILLLCWSVSTPSQRGFSSFSSSHRSGEGQPHPSSSLSSSARSLHLVRRSSRRGGTGTGASAIARRASAPSNAAAAKDPDAEERLRFLSLALLGQVDSAQELLEQAESKEGPSKTGNLLDSSRFHALLRELDPGIERNESDSLFTSLAPDGSLQVTQLKSRLRESGAITEMYAESLRNVGITVAISLLLAAAFVVIKGPSSGVDFLTGYLVEDSLSVDNLFVFLLLFRYFKVPPGLQSYCLNVGIVGAVVLRALFIILGLAAINAFRPVLLAFGVFLIFSSVKLWTGLEEEEDDGEPPEIVQQVLKLLPTASKFNGENLTVTAPGGQVLFTPLALCIISIELCDILFAVDSVPAVFAITNDPAVVYLSNIAAILGLRSLYQVLAVAVQDLEYLEKGVALVLGFVGLKLCLCVFGFELGSSLSSAVIVTILGTSIFLSLRPSDEEDS